MKAAINGKRQWMAWGALLACLGGAQTAKADLLLAVQSVTVTPGSINDQFNVSLTNTGATPVDVAAFNFEINTTSTDITFEQATTGTTLNPYILAGNSFDDSFFSGVISISSPGQTLLASDLALTPGSFTVVKPGASFGLGLVSFNTAPGAPNQVAPVSFNTSIAATSVSDQFGTAQTLDFVSGSITVPEPTTGLLILVPFAGLVAAKRLRRQ